MASPATSADAFARVRALGFVGSAMRLADIDLPRLGHRIGVGEDEIHAVIDVETAGGGFDKLKRPKMLFEPHRFYANLAAGPKRDAAVAQGLAYPKWRKDYPSDSYPRLFQAMQIDETAALKSASWGLGQIMGENYVAAGYDSPQQMVLAFVEGGEAEHLEAMINFIVANHLDDELRAHNWAGFARGYNGPKYAENAYHTKLAAAFTRWAKIKDTAWSPEMDVVTAPAVPTAPVVVAPLPPVAAKPAPAPVPLPPVTVQAQPSFWARIGRWIDDTFGDRA
ncbi:N-acetylmuramidase family protein [Methylobacterium durans]|uniref:Peptidoglycan-binding protein n=1 Tax=Methylobacterium durans TaxID=2202825 RepID=A0A2U8WAJ7_9HYPH|nr:N-acetylmuramidase family protein [Methylobacterium durans]AWN43183.1 peptidoglycan-binding protein [Methylobacterium durans]